MIQQFFERDKVTYNEIIIGTCVVLFVLLITTILKKKKRNYPPGPTGLPIVGYLPFLTDKPHLKLIELSKKYGDIFSINLGSEPVIVLNSTDAVKEAFLRPAFLGRPPYGTFAMLRKQSPFFSSPVHAWQEQRRFVVHSMKDLGLGKSKTEGHIKDEINRLLEHLQSHNGRPMDLDPPLASSTSNNISALMFDTRYEYNHPSRIFLDQNTREISDAISQTTIYTIFPWIRHIPFINNEVFKKGVLAFEDIHKFFSELVQEHKKTLDPQNIRDYVDSYLIQIESQKQKDPNTTFNDETLIDGATDLFGAGSDTVKHSVLWCVYIMAAFPEIQKRIQEEILDVIGQNRMAEFLDLKSMPFTHATLLEVLRWKTTVPLNLLHYTTEDTTLGGYNIPRNTSVMANFWAIHHDPAHWTDPDSFKPERFLSPDGKTIVKSPNYMPFSIGKRDCPGKTMAYMEIFLYLVSILQKFDIVFPDGTKPTFDYTYSLTFKPKTYKIRFLSKTQS